MINKYNSGRVDYIGMIKIKLSYGGCTDMNVYTSNDKELYDQLDDIDYMHRYVEDHTNYKDEPYFKMDEIDNGDYYLFNEIIQNEKRTSNNISIFLKKPITAATYAKFIEYFDKATSSNFREFLKNTCIVLVLKLKNKGFIATTFDLDLMQKFNSGEFNEIPDYESDYGLSVDYIRDLFD